MKQLLLILFCTVLSFVHAQQSEIDLGLLNSETIRYADIMIPNTTEKTFYLVKVEHSPEIVYRVSDRYTNPDSVLTVRIQVNPDEKGLFDHVLRIYISDRATPYEWRVKGQVDELPDYTDVLQQKCPEFIEDDRKKETEFTVFTIDAVTKEVLRGSKLTIVYNGAIEQSWQTGATGSLRQKMEPGFAHFVASFPGYFTTETGIFISPEVENIYIPLVKTERERDTVPDLIVTAEPVEIPEKDQQQTLDEQFKNTKPEAEEEENLSFGQIPFSDSNYFRPVNIVFVLDLSESMKRGDKLSLMKFSLQQLIRELRPQDNIALVVYSENAKLLVPKTSGENKYELRNAVADLVPQGTSSSVKGLKEGYRQFEDEPSNAINMLIIITDGAFNDGSDSYQKIVRKNESLASFNVVAIQPSQTDEMHLERAAKFGDGSYAVIRKLEDASEKLLSEIRKASYTGK